MPTTYRGGCSCSAIRYEIAAEPILAGQCQCRDCQHETGGGHTSFVAFPTDAVRLTGTPRFYEVKTDSGGINRRGFCPTCGSPVVGTTSGAPGMTTVSAGSLDDPSLFEPQFVCFRSRGHAWDFIDPALPAFSTMPP